MLKYVFHIVWARKMIKAVDEIYQSLKNSAKLRNIEFTLTKTDLWLIDIPITCPVFGFPLRTNRGKVQFDSYSFDRIDNNVGYIATNIIIVSYRANILKKDASILELKQLYEFYSSLS